MRLLYSEELNEAGYEVISAESGYKEIIAMALETRLLVGNLALHDQPGLAN